MKGKHSDLKVRLTAEMKEALLRAAAADGETNISMVVRRAVNWYLKQLADNHDENPQTRPVRRTTQARRAAS